MPPHKPRLSIHSIIPVGIAAQIFFTVPYEFLKFTTRGLQSKDNATFSVLKLDSNVIPPYEPRLSLHSSRPVAMAAQRFLKSLGHGTVSRATCGVWDDAVGRLRPTRCKVPRSLSGLRPFLPDGSNQSVPHVQEMTAGTKSLLGFRTWRREFRFDC